MVNNLKNRIRCLGRIGLILIFSVVTFFSNAQFDFVSRHAFAPEVDSITFDKRSGPEHIDSMDLAYYNLFPTLFNNGRAIMPFFQSMNTFGSYRYFFTDERPIYRANYHFSGLPYTGFFYSFGGGGEQILDLRYTQNVGQSFNISFRYNRSVSDQSSAGFEMRRSEYITNDISMNFHYHKGKFNSFLESYFGFDNYHENFGLDSLGLSQIDFPLVQLPVNNGTAFVRTRRAQVDWRNEFTLLKDSVTSLKYVFKPGFHTFQRRYRDSLLFENFDTWQIDSMNTRDSWEEPHILLENGVSLQKRNLQLYGGFVFDYFHFYNFGKRAERLDGYLIGAVKYASNKLKLNGDLRYFVFGTPGELNSKLMTSYQIAPKVNVSSRIGLDRFYPEFFQLFYTSNHLSYNNSQNDLAPTSRFFGELKATYGTKRKMGLSGSYLNVANLYYFSGSNWSFDGNQQIYALGLNWDLKWKKLVFQGNARLFSGEKNLLGTPDYHVYSRLFLDGALFKAQRLKIATGLDFHFFQGYQVFSYQPEIGVFNQATGDLILQQQNLMLNAFVNLQMDRFRFFLSVNRINTLFENRKVLIENVPFRPFFIRLGLSWDFVN